VGGASTNETDPESLAACGSAAAAAAEAAARSGGTGDYPGFPPPQKVTDRDGYDAATSEAWSVVIKGRAREVRMFDQPDDSTFWLFPWSATPKSRFVRITPERVSGRRFRVVRHRPPTNGSDPRRDT